MNVATIEMDPAEAKEKLRAVRAQLHRRADEEYQALEVGYEALAKGTPLIHLGDSVRLGGLGADHRPRFAVARADQRQVDFEWDGRLQVVFRTPSARGRWPRGKAAAGRVFRFNFEGVPGMELRPRENLWELRATALVPMVPPDIREQDRGALDKRFILWEVESWTKVPPRDPLLLRHVGGDLYAVTGAWDLTELERAVMAGRRNG